MLINTWPAVPAPINEVRSGAVWNGIFPTSPPAKFDACAIDPCNTPYIVPPTCRSLLIPTPPFTINAPLSDSVEFVSLVIVTISSNTVAEYVMVVYSIVNCFAFIVPLTVKFFPIYTFPPIPAPPVTTKAPVRVFVEVVGSLMVILGDVNNFSFVLYFKSLLTP